MLYAEINEVSVDADLRHDFAANALKAVHNKYFEVAVGLTGSFCSSR